MTHDDARFGYTIEKWANEQLKILGWTTRLMPDWYAPYDLIIDEFLPVEVKASKPYTQHSYGSVYRQRWQFNLAGGLDPARADFLYVLVAVDREGELWPYVIPSSWTIGHSLTPSLTSHPTRYSGWLSSGLNAWHLVERVYHWRQTYTATEAGQLTLPIFA